MAWIWWVMKAMAARIREQKLCVVSSLLLALLLLTLLALYLGPTPVFTYVHVGP